MDPKPSALAYLFDAVSLQTMGQLKPEASYAIVEWHQEMDLMPSFAQSLQVFKNVPAQWVEVPVAEFARAVMAEAEIAGNHKTFEDYRQWYVDRGDTPTYSIENRWPCIFCSSDYEIISDGWHRMHAYVRAGHATIPVLNFDHDAWWKAHALWTSQQPALDPAMSHQPSF